MMNEDFLKVELSPAEGQMFGTFTEGMPLAEALGSLVVMHIDYRSGVRMRYYGIVAAVVDELKNIDNTDASDDQVVRTYVYMVDGPNATIVWADVAVAVGEVASHTGGES